jgi:hypothetical protein
MKSTEHSWVRGSDSQETTELHHVSVGTSMSRDAEDFRPTMDGDSAPALQLDEVLAHCLQERHGLGPFEIVGQWMPEDAVKGPALFMVEVRGDHGALFGLCS